MGVRLGTMAAWPLFEIRASDGTSASYGPSNVDSRKLLRVGCARTCGNSTMLGASGVRTSGRDELPVGTWAAIIRYCRNNLKLRLL